ncbi:hypothetical protein [Streptomyces sp. NBC_00453]|uniref:hypothetical protein n=1 Tax=Streptomyces sp. NBC_00453 TaxID=2903653 RepID=UPI002E1A777F
MRISPSSPTGSHGPWPNCQRGTPTSSVRSPSGDCGNVLAAINFLNWFGTQHLSLSQLQQRHLDTWAIERSTLRSRSIPFLRWSTARRLCPPDLVIERSAAQLPGHFQAE